MGKHRQLSADLLLLLVALIWGGTFVMVRNAVESYPVFPFLALRFCLATLALLPLGWRRLKSLGWRGVGAGVLIGLFLFAAYSFQTFGLCYTTASKTGLITGLSVVLVPLLAALLLRQLPSIPSGVGVVFAMVGLVLLTLDGGLTIQKGDALVFVCALCFALHIVSVAAFAPKADPIALTIVQLSTVALLSAGMAFIAEPVWPTPARSTWFAAAFTGILATALAFGLQTAMQRFTTPTHTALIFTAEPLFAAIFGVLLVHDVLPPRGVVGGVLIILGTIISQLPWSERTAKIISRFLAPQYVMSALLLSLALSDPVSWQRGLAWAAIVGLLAVGLPLLLFMRQLRNGRISDWHISKREERLQPVLIAGSIVAPAMTLALLCLLDGPRTMLVGLSSALIVIILNLAITHWWKISQHASAIAASTTLATFVLGAGASPILLLVPLVAWSRVKLGAHTILQTIAGGAVGCAITLLALYLAG